jgi:hypothetical protein
MWDRRAEVLSRKDFDSLSWTTSLTNDDSNPIRLTMVDSLLKKYKLSGMARTDLDALLGIPPKTDYFKDYDYVYWLGPERGFMSIDSEWLAIKFDTQGKVSEAKILRD